MAVVGAGGAGMDIGHVSRFGVYRARLGPETGADATDLRPCVIVSPDEMNGSIGTVIVAPLMSRGSSYPTRIECEFRGREAQVVLDQLRTVAAWRLVEGLGRLDEDAAKRVLAGLRELFAP